MRRPPLIVIVIAAAFLAGGILGYALPPASASEKLASNKQEASRPSSKRADAPARTARGGKSSNSAREAGTSPLGMDAEGNYLLSPRLQNRFSWSVVFESDVADTNLLAAGFNKEEIEKLRVTVKEILQECSEQEQTKASVFTESDGELVLKVTGDPAAAAARQQRLIELLSTMDKGKARLLEAKLMQELGKATCDLGGKDFFLRVTLTKSVPQGLEFDYLADIGTPHEIELKPGDSFAEWRKAGLFPVRGYSNRIPPHAKLLLEDERWKDKMPVPGRK